MLDTKSILLNMYDKLFDQFGPQNWWPADSLLEMIIGALLTQNTAWTNVIKAIGNIKQANLLELNALLSLGQKELSQLIRPSGYYNQKATSLQSLLQFFNSETNGDLQRFFQQPLNDLRTKLLNVRGVGPETADSILLYGGNQLIFVIDAYTKRIFKRHGLIMGDEPYESIRFFVEKNLPADVYLYQEFHALIVKAGAVFCSSKPDCQACPLSTWRNFYISESSLPYNEVCINANCK